MKKCYSRLPVRWRSTPLMPMKTSRVSKMLKLRRGVIRYDRKLNQHYLQLKKRPSGWKLQPITLGIDPGSSFDGFSVVSKHCHHLNIELIQRPKKGKNSIKAFMKRRATNRKVRRSRLRHRPVRFDNRTSKKMVPTIRADLEFRQWLVTRLLRLFPISTVVVEDVSFNHYTGGKKGKLFSHIELGKTKLYEWIKAQGLKLILYKGFNTKKLRVNSWGRDVKVKDKGKQSFYAHCVDSFVLACNKRNLKGEPYVTNVLRVNRKVTFIEKIVKIRRCLDRNRQKYLDAKRYYRFKKGGVKEFFVKMGKRNICRVKPEGEHSNHPKQWSYIDNGRVEKLKCNKAPYGGTTLKGKSFFDGSEWRNRKLWTVYSDKRVEQR